MCGGAGFIGSTFVKQRLATTEDSVVVLDKLTYAGNRLNIADVEADAALAPRFQFVRGDIADAEAVDPLVRDADAVVNFAAESHVDRSILDAEAFLRTGVIGVQSSSNRSAASRRNSPNGLCRCRLMRSMGPSIKD